MKVVKGTFLFIIPAAVILAIWLPVILHYYVPNTTITDEMIELSRYSPASSVFNELNRFDLIMARLWENEDQLVRSAERLLQGKIEIPGFTPRNIAMPFATDEIDKGLPSWQLLMASFAIPKILIDAFHVTGRDDFFKLAQNIIHAWSLFEKKALLPRGFLWNDHAIAARVFVFTEFWSIYRNHPEFQVDIARSIMQLAARSVKLLAKPSQFTFATNHGVMQNLAIWQICIVFPLLPNVEQYKQLAYNRLNSQFDFYINDEGAILEHSAGYQEFGLELISMALKYLSLMNVPIPNDWVEKYSKAKNFYGCLRRPDGSLPKYGDTDKSLGDFGPLVTDLDTVDGNEKIYYNKNWEPQQSHNLFPVAGYSIWWDGLKEWPNELKLSQTFIGWSFFPKHGHKHADEMSFLLWAGGQEWWTSVGNWPYGVNGRSNAESWSGSNAPHLLNENTRSLRDTKLRYSGWLEEIAAIDLERNGPQDYLARRQIVHLKPSLWIVVDSTSGSEGNLTTTIWTASHKVKLKANKVSGTYELLSKDRNLNLTTFFLGSVGTQLKQFKGSFNPFAGWEVDDLIPRSTSAIVIEQPANNSWSAAIMSLGDGHADLNSHFELKPFIQHWENSESWQIDLPLKSGYIKISRKGDRVSVLKSKLGAEFITELILSQGPEIGKEKAQISQRFEILALSYPKFKEFLKYRFKVTYLLIFIFVVQEITFFAYKRKKWRYYNELRYFNTISWAGLGSWLVLVYFKT